jgi:hypothetical protein
MIKRYDSDGIGSDDIFEREDGDYILYDDVKKTLEDICDKCTTKLGCSTCKIHDAYYNFCYKFYKS